MKRLALLLLCVCAAPTTTYAVADAPSTGTLVAAALETAGYHTQQRVLGELGPLIELVAALITLLCIAVAIFVTATSGSFDSARWLLVGPPVLFALIQVESQASPPEWQFGVFDDQAGERAALLRSSGLPATGNFQVSRFFHQFNRLTSEIVQDLVRFFNSNSARPMMMFMTRQKMLAELFSMEVGDPGLMALARLNLVQCGAEMEAARRIGQGQTYPEFQREGAYQEAVRIYCEQMERPNKEITPEVRIYLKNSVFSPAERTTYLAEHQPERATCAQLWNWMYRGVQATATGIAARIAVGAVNTQAVSYYAPIYQEIWRDIVEKINTVAPGVNPRAVGVVCPNSTNRITVNSAEAAVPLIFAAWMIRKLQANDPRGQMMQQLWEHAGLEVQPQHYREFHSLERNQAKVMRMRNASLAEAAKWEAYSLAMRLPYLQGAGLYILASTFPFFALLVLIPGRAGSFFIWCALWVWLKSWDVGWSLVMIVDQVLWHLMPHTTYFRFPALPAAAGTERTYVLQTDPVTVLEAAFVGDYGFTLSTYYVMLGCVISAVPVISAHAVLGSKRAVAGVMVNGLKSLGQVFSKASGDWVAVEHTAGEDRDRELGNFLYTRARLEPHYRAALIDHSRHAPGAQAGLWAAQLNQFINGGDQATKAVEAAKWDPATGKGSPAMRSPFMELLEMQGKSPLDFILNPSKLDPRNLVGGLESGTPLANGLVPQKGIGLKHPDMIRGQGADYKAPTPELEAYKRAIETTRMEGDVLRSAADAYLASGGLLGTLLAPLDLIPKGALASKGGKYVGGRVAGWGLAAHTAGIDLQRTANAHTANYMMKLAEHYFYEGSKETPALSAERRRAGISTRVEWWNAVDAPVALSAEVQALTARLDQEHSFIKGRLLGDVTLGLIGPSKGRFAR